MEICGDMRKFAEMRGDVWRFVEICGDVWRYVEMSGDKSAINYLITQLIIKMRRLINLIKYNFKILIKAKKV